MASIAAVPAAETPVSRNAITAVVILASFMTVLDSTIANVALPFMQPSLGAASDTIAWVLTSYIVATAIATPLTGWLAELIGRRQLFLWSVAGFVAASMLCGLAQSLEQMVVFRMLQGAFGAFLTPLGQAFILDAWPKAKHGQAMALWGVGIMVGPILGPVFGGYLTESFDWRWVFFINLPFGIVALLGGLAVLPDLRTTARRFDLLGFSLLAIGVAALQLCLDRGQQLDWFASWEVRIEAGVAAAALWSFGVHVATRTGTILDRRILADRNMVTGMCFIVLIGVLMISTTALLPTMLERLLGYPAMTTGFVMAPRGVGIMASMILVGRLVGKVDARLLMGIGFVLVSLSLWWMSLFSPQMDSSPVIVTGLVQGVGMGLIFVPLNTIAFATLAPELRTDAAGFFQLLRNIGGSVGVSLSVGVLARQTQISHADIGTGLTPFSTPWADGSFAAVIGSAGDTLTAMVDGAVNAQAAMIAYVDVYRMLFWITVAMMPLLLMMRKPGGAAPPPELMTE
ncbi:MAG: DHA2 family efflux MFS transporter permease subunit [Polymorphobacter sp.]